MRLGITLLVVASSMKRLGKGIANIRKKPELTASISAPAPAAATSRHHADHSGNKQTPGRMEAAPNSDLEMSLGGLQLQYEDHRWTAIDGSGGTCEGAPVLSAAAERETDELRKENQRLRAEHGMLSQQQEGLARENESLRGEAHLLRFKMEMLVDMVTLANLDCDQLQV